MRGNLDDASANLLRAAALGPQQAKGIHAEIARVEEQRRKKSTSGKLQNARAGSHAQTMSAKEEDPRSLEELLSFVEDSSIPGAGSNSNKHSGQKNIDNACS